MSEEIRSFIAVPIPPETVAKLSAIQTQLRPSAGNVKWVGSESFHVTLKFLGGVEPERLQRTWEAVQAELVKAARFTLLLRGAGAFPSRTRARVIWAGIETGKTELAALAQSVEHACSTQGFAPEQRPFQAHITLGRIREPVLNHALAQAIEELSQEYLGEVNVDRVFLMRSELTPQGARYSVLKQYQLPS